MRDPFVIPEAVEKIEVRDEDILKQLPFKLTIKGVVMNEIEKYAIINNSIVREKDTYQSITIDVIAKNYISIIYGQRTIKVPYKKETD